MHLLGKSLASFLWFIFTNERLCCLTCFGSSVGLFCFPRRKAGWTHAIIAILATVVLISARGRGGLHVQVR